MKITITCLLLTAALWTGAGHAAEATPPAKPAKEVDVKKDLESIVASCEKKKLPAEKEIECIEQGYLQFMGEAAPGDS